MCTVHESTSIALVFGDSMTIMMVPLNAIQDPGFPSLTFSSSAREGVSTLAETRYVHRELSLMRPIGLF